MQTRFIAVLIASIYFNNMQAQKTMNAIDNSLAEKLINGRAFFEGLGKSYPSAPGVAVQQELIDGVSCYWLAPEKPVSEKLIIYLHGGGFVMGSIHSHQAMVSHITRHIGARTLLIEYALAPEHPYPQGLNDVVKVYKAILQREPGAEIFFIGDSAGGGLAVSTIAALQQQNTHEPSGVVLISPWLNLNGDTPSYQKNAAIDPILTVESVNAYATAYNPDHVSKANPSSIIFKHFPPVHIVVGSREILLDDSQNFYDHVRHVQSDATLHIFRDQTHVWPLTDISHQDTHAALEAMARFISEKKK